MYAVLKETKLWEVVEISFKYGGIYSKELDKVRDRLVQLNKDKHQCPKRNI